MIPPPPTSTLFPYTTLFRSGLPPLVGDFSSAACGGVVKTRTASVGVRKRDRKSTRLNSSHLGISYAVFCLKKKNCLRGQTARRRGDWRSIWQKRIDSSLSHS